MYCKKCGAVINDNASFCNKCGEKNSFETENENSNANIPIIEEAENEQIRNSYDENDFVQENNYNESDDKNSKNKMKIALAVIGAVFVCIVVVIVILIKTIFGISADKLISYIDSNDYKGLYDYYDEMDRKDINKIRDDFKSLLSDKYSDIQSKFSSGDIKLEDIGYLKDVVSGMDIIDSDYSTFANNIDTINSSISSYNSGKKYFDEGDMQSALTSFEAVSKLDTAHYSDAQKKIKEIQKAIDDAQVSAIKTKSDEIKSKIASGDYDSAAEMIDALSAKYGNSADVQALKNEFKNTLLSSVDSKLAEYFDALDYEGARKYLENIYYSFNFEELDTKNNNLEAEFSKYALEKSKTDADAGNYDAALALVKQAMDVVGEDSADYEQLNSAYNEYRKHIAVYLTELNYMAESDSGVADVDRDLTDNIGDVHRHSYTSAGWINRTGERWQEFYINGNYKTLSGIAGVREQGKSSDDTDFFDIYGDGELLYTSSKMSKSSLPEDFEVDISGVKVLKISFPATQGDTLATIYDAKLEPDNDKSGT